jgi:hypothetical protein
MTSFAGESPKGLSAPNQIKIIPSETLSTGSDQLFNLSIRSESNSFKLKFLKSRKFFKATLLAQAQGLVLEVLG